MVKEIPLTQGKFVLVDNEDFERLNQFKWHLSKGRNTCYAKSWIYSFEKRFSVRMHRLLLNPSSPLLVDHIDGNGLNNQKSNLRIVTCRENLQNLHIKKTSRFSGVSYDNRDCRWRSCILIKGKRKYLGFFNNEIAAYQAYIDALDSI